MKIYVILCRLFSEYSLLDRAYAKEENAEVAITAQKMKFPEAEYMKVPLEIDDLDKEVVN